MRKNVVPNFIEKTWEILQDDKNGQILRWTESECSFIVLDRQRLCNEILPMHFKHSNFSSFVRQLNMYNFHKMRNNEQKLEFFHKLFRKDHRQLLIGIKRKPSEAEIVFGDELISKMGSDIRSIKLKDNGFSENSRFVESISMEQSPFSGHFQLPFYMKENPLLIEKIESQSHSQFLSKMDCENSYSQNLYTSNYSSENNAPKQLSINYTQRQHGIYENRNNMPRLNDPYVLNEKPEENCKKHKQNEQHPKIQNKLVNPMQTSLQGNRLNFKIIQNIILKGPPTSNSNQSNSYN